MEKMKIAIGSDHAGFDLKEYVKTCIKDIYNIDCEDFGCYSNERTDYPDHAHAVCNSIEKGVNNIGILICGSGNGINMTANKHRGIRAALCWNDEIAELARAHNNANVLSMPARFLTEEEAKQIVNKFLKTTFEGGRHQGRIDKIGC